MEYQVPEHKQNARPAPKRGQVKVKIVGILVRACKPKATKKGEKPQQEGGGRLVPSTPPLSGYTSETGSDL